MPTKNNDEEFPDTLTQFEELVQGAITDNMEDDEDAEAVSD